jgi:DNA replication and repair protein RecF
MWVQALNLINFRSYEDVTVECEPGVNIFVGPNGQGKTNIVEAIYYLATLSSHRVSSDQPLVKTGAESAVIRAMFVEADKSVSIDLEIKPGKTNRAKVNRSQVTRSRDILGIIRAVMFSPEDLSLVKGEPGERRNFLDETLIQRFPRFSGVKADYEKVLKQRNALLRSPNKENIESTLEVWDDQLIKLGTEIIFHRVQLINDLRPFFIDRYHTISGGQQAVSSSNVGLEYQSKFMSSVDLAPLEITNEFKDALSTRRRDELIRGVTLVGPHRDELLLTLGELPIKGFASHGESWSASLALRLASADVLRADGVEPIMILDDVFAELDTMRRETLVELVRDAPQVFITAAVEGDIPLSIGGVTSCVSLGSVQPAHPDEQVDSHD